MRLSLFILLLLLWSCSPDSRLKKDLKDLLGSSETATAAQDSIKTRELPAGYENGAGKNPENSKKRDALVIFAQRYIGTPYVYASADPAVGFDCSGFINYVYRHFGYGVPRSSKEFLNFGRDIPLGKVQRGDLLIFTGTDLNSPEIGHIGIVLNAKGKNSNFIHSSSGKANGVTISSLGSPHYSQRFVKAISVMD